MNKRHLRLTAAAVAAFVLLGAASYLQAQAYAAGSGKTGTEPAASAAPNGGSPANDAAAKESRQHPHGEHREGKHPGGKHGGKAMFGFDALQTAADVLGMEAEALCSELEKGKTLAQLGEAKGMKREDLVAKLNAAVAKRLDERVAAGELSKDQAEAIKAKASEHMAAAVDSNRLGLFMGRGGHGHGMGRFASTEELAKMLGMTEDALRAELMNGKSLAEIAASAGISEDQLIAKLKENMTDELQRFVRAKRPAPKPSSAEDAAGEDSAAEDAQASE